MAPWLLLSLLAAAEPGPAPGGALAGLADGVAARLSAPEEGRRALAVALTVEPPALAAPLSAALAGSLGAAGWSASQVPAGPGAEAAARAAGADWLLALRAGASAGGAELAAVGEATPLWRSFFLQARPGVPPVAPRLVTARAPSDAAVRLLLEGTAPASALTLRELVRLPYPVVALAAGQVEGLGPVLLVVGPDAVRLLDRAGVELASRPLVAAGRRPVRRPAATAVVAPLGAGPFGLALAGASGGEVLVRRGARLERAALLPMAPLAAGEPGVLFGAFAPGKAALQDLRSLGVDGAARPRSAGDLAAVAAAPGRAAPAFGLLHPDGRLELLDGALGAAGEVTGIGAGFALADLDGDGRSELVTSLDGPGNPDRVRVLRLPPAAAPAPAPDFESAALEGEITTAAAADLTGDGRDDVVLAAVLRDGAAGATVLWLLTQDPREAR